MSFKKMIVTLKNQKGEQTKLEYNIRKTKSAQLWANSLHKASTSGFRENDRFSNFPNHPRSNLQNLIGQLQELIFVLKDLHPELNFPIVDPNHLQESVNLLHHSFAHSHLVTNTITEKNERPWLEYNTLLHAIEGILISQKYESDIALPLAGIIFTWKDQCRVDIPEDCYKDFIFSKQFGTAYVNYSQVGRHFHELYFSQDQHLDDAHIQPYRYISADTWLWFGPSTGHFLEKATMDRMESWFTKHKARFNKLGFYWGDPKLAIGNIPVATLSEPHYSVEEIKAFIEHLALFNEVHMVEIF